MTPMVFGMGEAELCMFCALSAVHGSDHRRVLVFYGRVPTSHWQPHPQGINLYKSRGIRKGSRAILVIYAFINNRKELRLGLFGLAPLLWNSQREQIKVAKVGLSKQTHFLYKVVYYFLLFKLLLFLSSVFCNFSATNTMDKNNLWIKSPKNVIVPFSFLGCKM